MDEAIFEKVLNHYGDLAQKHQTIEELDELKNEVGFSIVNGTPNRKGVLTEFADVMNMMKQLALIYKFSRAEIIDEMSRKMNRTLDRIEKDGGVDA